MMILERSLMLYLQEIRKIPMLNREEEYKIAKKALAGNENAKKRLVESNLRFVIQVAGKYRNCGLPVIDLINEGNIGLMRAVETFDPDKGFHFISYAVHWIRQAILKAISDKGKLIRLPLNRNNDLIQIEKAMNTNGNTHNPKLVEKVSKDLNFKVKYTNQLLSVSRRHISLDSLAQNNDQHSATVIETIEDHTAEKPQAALVQESLQNSLTMVLNTLTDQEKEVIKLRFGLTGKDPMTLLEIGYNLGLTKERIRQIEKKALQRLRHPTRRKQLKDYIS
ncbi:MAG: hypothetical protein A2096_15240 [Spirochaetes bacterium GWF1_41_5]|nr:MAG: hypothetical protein A2096_15240 [Spirochaetes bacterium GWF1_41_5]HBE01853.1 RNA polymerase subunit sigma [Spirochaetia bacterium]